MTNSLHIKLEYSEALRLKRETLLLREKILENLSHLKNFADLKKKRIALRNKLRILFSQLSKEITIIEKELPDLSEQKNHKKNTGNEREEKHAKESGKEEKTNLSKKQKEIAKEIKEIQEKLARLG